MKISKNTRRHLDTARLLMESVSVESVHRRLVQIRQEIMALSREFESAYDFERSQDVENNE